MQGRFDFGGGELPRWRSMLTPLLQDIAVLPRRKPIGQLVKSLISGRTRDDVSLAAYHRLGRKFRSAKGISLATSAEVEATINDVTFAQAKAERLVAALQKISEDHPDFALNFLADFPLLEALDWLERLPGVGRKVAASTLNASTLARPVFIVDTHVLRVLRRLGFVAANAEARIASERVTADSRYWDADDFLLFHIAVKRLGQTICTAEKPKCQYCSLAADCSTAKRLRN